jgi:hypothetical protein
MILQLIRNKYIRFGGHVDIQVRYKIIMLEVPKKAPILHNPPCFQEGLFRGNFRGVCLNPGCELFMGAPIDKNLPLHLVLLIRNSVSFGLK